MFHGFKTPLARTLRLVALTGALSGQSLAAADDAAPPQQPANAALAVFADADSDLHSLVTSAVVQTSGPKQPEKLSEFWIGISGNDVDGVLRSHLELAANQGLLVTQVVADSPAAKAGIKTNDVLLSAGDKPLKEIADLASLIEESRDAKLTIGLIRGGKPVITQVTPERRPPSQTGETCPAVSKAGDDVFLRRVYVDLLGVSPDDEKVRLWVDDKSTDKRTKLVNRLLRQSTTTSRSCTNCHTADAETTQLYEWLIQTYSGNLYRRQWKDALQAFNVLARPGVIVVDSNVDSTGKGVALPDDLTITITRKGKEPAKITVRKGDHLQEAAESDYMEKISEDLRGHVEAALMGRLASDASGGDAAQQGLKWLKSSTDHSTPVWSAESGGVVNWLPVVNAAAHPTAAPPASVDDPLARIAKQIDALSGQLAELQKAFQTLQQSRQKETNKPPAGEKK